MYVGGVGDVYVGWDYVVGYFWEFVDGEDF